MYDMRSVDSKKYRVIEPMMLGMLSLSSVRDGDHNRIVSGREVWHYEAEFRRQLLACRHPVGDITVADICIVSEYRLAQAVLHKIADDRLN